MRRRSCSPAGTATAASPRAMTARADFVHPLPEGFDDLSVAPLLCGGVIGYRSLRIAGRRPRLSPGHPPGPLRLRGLGDDRDPAGTSTAGCEVHVVTRSEAEQQRSSRPGRRLGRRVRRRHHPSPSTRPSPSRRPGTWSSPRWQPSTAAGSWRSTRSTWTGSRSSTTTCCGGSGRCGRSPTSPGPTPASSSTWPRPIPIRTRTEVFDLAEANEALARLHAGRIAGAAVLAVG